MFSDSSNNKHDLSDSELIERYRFSHDNVYIGELFQRYSHILFGVCLKYVKNEDKAKDIVMMVFEKVLMDLKRHPVANFKAWIYTVTKNQCLMDLRKVSRANQKQQDYAYLNKDFVDFDLPAHLHGESDAEKDQKLHSAINELKDEQRQCIRMYYFEKKSYEEIEAKTGYTYKQVKSFLQNGKRNLKIKLSNANE